MEHNITVFHSPDADDAFMFYGVVSGHVTIPGYRFHSELRDIETLNQMALRSQCDATAVSVHAYSYLAQNYAILTHGSSMGECSYGPRLVVKSDCNKTLAESEGFVIGLPGELTSATLAMKLYLKEQRINAKVVQFHFEELESAVLNDEIDGGLLIHEGQITHTDRGLKAILDLGSWWWERTELPLPLGVNIVKKSLPPDTKRAIASGLYQSIRYSLEHRHAALDYALSFGRGLSRERADEFVAMYVNRRTLNLKEQEKISIELFLQRGAQAGLCPVTETIEFV